MDYNLDKIVENQVEKYRKAVAEQKDKLRKKGAQNEKLEHYKYPVQFATEAQTSEEYIKALGRNAQLGKHPVRRNNSSHFYYARDSSTLAVRPISHVSRVQVMLNPHSQNHRPVAESQVVPCFEAVFPSECKQIIHLNQTPMRIGRNDVSSSSIMSKDHVEVFLSRSEKTYMIRLMDLNSTNGTFINGKRLEPLRKKRLQEEDIVSFGSPEARIQYRVKMPVLINKD